MLMTARQLRQRRLRPAFTLVELLVVMGVLALMSSLVLVGLASAAETARLNRTRSQIMKIHALIMERYDSYRYRRIEPLASIDSSGGIAGSARYRARYRVDRIRDLMRMEMPCHVEDVTNGSAVKVKASPVAYAGSCPLHDRFYRTAGRRAGGIGNWTTAFEDSECLYMILESIQDGEMNGLDFLKPSEIGDLDGDGMPEVLDAWGRPIRFLRWAPGFYGARSNLHKNDSPDPFDPLGVRGGKVQASANQFLHFPLYPLVISSGPDQELDILMRGTSTSDMNNLITGSSPYSVPNDPYVTFQSSDPDINSKQFGTEMDANKDLEMDYLDNISNHDLVISGNDK
ncbi:prepilin-type N-terminal cleavage/methylation domain-containing protein [bacterium]|nr:prepilin-type N-terminal cleavage/methylation domain-containing protein [bacterium]